jgi:hypothetical protein
MKNAIPMDIMYLADGDRKLSLLHYQGVSCWIKKGRFFEGNWF